MKRMDAVIYIRVSTEEQTQGTSLDSQETDCRAFCARNKYAVTHVFADRGESAKSAARPQFLSLVAHCQKYKPAVVVVWKFDRWARNSQDHAIYSAAISKAGTRLLSATEPVEDNPSGRLMETILSAFAQFDNEVRADRSRRAMREVVKRGGWITHAPFGFQCHRTAEDFPILIPHPVKSAVAIEMFNGIATGRRNTIQTILFAREYGLSANSVREILRKPVYAGFMRGVATDNREIETAFPGLIPRDTWQTVQDILDGKSRNMGRTLTEREEFPLRSLMVCADCGKPITASWSNGRSKRYAYYHCQDNHLRVPAETVHQSWLNLLVSEAEELIPILTQLRTDVKEVVLERVRIANQVNRVALDNQKRIANQREKLLDLHLTGGISAETFRTKDAELSARYASISANTERVIDWVALVDDTVSKAVQLFEDPVALWARYPLKDRQRFCSALYSGKLVLTQSGKIEPPFGVGMTGLIRELTGPKIELVRLTGLISNLKNALELVKDLAA